MFVFRKRQFRDSIFLEFYLCLADGGIGLDGKSPGTTSTTKQAKVLDLPKTLPRRFEGRIIKSFSIQVSSLCGNDVVPCVLVDSKAPGVMKQTLQDITANGVWACYQDTISRGSYAGNENIVRGFPSFFGLHIHPSIYFKLYNGLSEAYLALGLNISHEPYIVYHGTARSTVPEILKKGLKSSYGMLGQAIYFGTFWKAFRFATRTQDYTKRQGAILRLYAFWHKVHVRTLDSDYCNCAKCIKTRQTDSRRLADHDSLWASFGDAVHVVAGGPLKNEEYACANDEKLCIVSVAHVESTTEHHEPLLRSLEIE